MGAGNLRRANGKEGLSSLVSITADVLVCRPEVQWFRQILIGGLWDSMPFVPGGKSEAVKKWSVSDITNNPLIGDSQVD